MIKPGSREDLHELAMAWLEAFQLEEQRTEPVFDDVHQEQVAQAVSLLASIAYSLAALSAKESE